MRRLVVGVVLLFFASVICIQGANFQAGFATIDITPPVGWRMSGYFYERLSTGIHDPLQAKAMVWRDGNTRAALVFCDLIGMPAVISEEVRLMASQKTGIPKANILIAATHTHTGPLYFGALREYLHAKAVRENGRDPFERVDYRGILADRLVSVILKADRSVRPVELYVAKTNVAGLAFNRRYHMKNGTVQFNPGKTNQNIVRPAGPVDPELFFLAFKRKQDRKLIGALTSFALHADTVGGTNYGADFPGRLAQFMKGVAGEEFISCFGNGPCGDINHMNLADPRPQKGDEEADRIGQVLGRQIYGMFPMLHPIEGAALGVRSSQVRVPLQEYSMQQILEAKENMEKIGTRDLPFLRQVEAYKIMDVQARRMSTNGLRLEVQAFRIGGDTVIVGLPGEIFCELGMALKRNSPFKNTIIVELSNDSIGYVPTRKAFQEGSYEIVNSRVQPGGGETIIETASKLLKNL